MVRPVLSVGTPDGHGSLAVRRRAVAATGVFDAAVVAGKLSTAPASLSPLRARRPGVIVLT